MSQRPRGVLNAVSCWSLAEEQLWLLTVFFFMARKQKIKDTTAVIVLEDGSTLNTSCICFGCSWLGNCILSHVIYSDS